MFKRENSQTETVPFIPVEITALEKFALCGYFAFTREEPSKQIADWLDAVSKVGLTVNHLVTPELVERLIAKRLLEEHEGQLRLSNLGHYFVTKIGNIQQPKNKVVLPKDFKLFEFTGVPILTKLIHTLISILAKKANDNVYAQQAMEKLQTKMQDLTVVDWAAELQ